MNLKLYLGENKSGKTNVIVENYLKALSEKIPSSNIIIFVRNKTLETELKNNILSKINYPIHELNIFRFRSFVTKIILNYWGYLTNNQPIFMGFSETISSMNFFLTYHKNYFKDIQVDRNFLEKVYTRQQRRAENNISFEKLNKITQIIEKDEFLLNVNKFLEDYEKWLINREKIILDYAGQLDFFSKLIKIPDIKNNICKKYSDLWLIEDIEEAIPSEISFYEQMYDLVPNFIYTGNKNGGIRKFMGADPEYINELEEKSNTLINLENSHLTEHELNFLHLGNEVLKINELITFKKEFETKIYLKNFLENNIKQYKSLTYSDMFNDLKNILITLIQNGVSAGEIAILTNRINEQIFLEVEYLINNLNLELDTIRGSSILIKNPIINSLITLLRIIFYEEIRDYKKIPNLTSFEFSQLLFIVGNIDNFPLSKLRKFFRNNVQSWFKFIKDYSQKEGYKTIRHINNALTYCRSKKHELSYNEIVLYIWKELFWNSNYFKKNKSFNELKIFLKMLNNHIEILKSIDNKNSFLDFIYQIIHGELSDNPDRTINLNNDKVKLLTFQKLGELKQSFQFQIWFDITSDNLSKNKFNRILNPYVISKRWPPYKEWDLDLEEEYSEKSMLKLIKSSLSLCKNDLYLLSSNYDLMGNMQNNNFLINFLNNYLK